jgi:uracil-DNA glycosylase
LDDWAAQGVLMLNPVLTVAVGQAGSHMDCGWQALTSEVVAQLAVKANPPAFLLWGRPASAFFDAACPAGAHPPVWRSRHPAHDFRREFMSGGSHFTATADRVDWWALGSQASGANVDLPLCSYPLGGRTTSSSD